MILITNADRIEIYPLDNLGRSTALHCIALREEGERRRFQIYFKRSCWNVTEASSNGHSLAQDRRSEDNLGHWKLYLTK